MKGYYQFTGGKGQKHPLDNQANWPNNTGFIICKFKTIYQIPKEEKLGQYLPGQSIKYFCKATSDFGLTKTSLQIQVKRLFTTLKVLGY